MEDWRKQFGAPFGGWAHPDSPAGGTGPGKSRSPRDLHHWGPSDVPHPDSPAGRTFDWSGPALTRIDIDERVRAVLDAIQVARRCAPEAILEATGVELGAILEGLIPMLLAGMCVVAATTALGTAAGAAIGALALGIGAGPGAAFGASAGFEAGVALLEGLGLAFLVTVVGASVADAGRLAQRGVREAWHAVEDPGSKWFHIDHAGGTLANAAAALMRGILQGIVAFLVAKGANAAAPRVPELLTRLRASRLGEGFAVWVERNWASLVKNERLTRQSTPAPAARLNRVNAPKSASPAKPSAATSHAGRKSSPKDPPPRRVSGAPSEPILDAEYVNAVARFKGQSPDEVTAFYEKEMSKGIDHRPLIDSALENHPGLTRAEAEAIYGYTGNSGTETSTQT